MGVPNFRSLSFFVWSGDCGRTHTSKYINLLTTARLTWICHGNQEEISLKLSLATQVSLMTLSRGSPHSDDLQRSQRPPVKKKVLPPSRRFFVVRLKVLGFFLYTRHPHLSSGYRGSCRGKKEHQRALNPRPRRDHLVWHKWRPPFVRTADWHKWPTTYSSRKTVFHLALHDLIVYYYYGMFLRRIIGYWK